MEILVKGLVLITILTCASSNRAKRYVGNGQRGGNEWNWNQGGQLTEGQNKGIQQNVWGSNRGDGGSDKRRADTKTNRAEQRWNNEPWSSGSNPDMGRGNEPQGNNKGSAYPDAGTPGGDLKTLLKGVPGMDFPDYLTVPDTDFDCGSMPSRGYYGDVDAGCQVFHICQPGNRRDSFLCPVGTLFNQKYFVCDWWFNVNCSETPSHYGLNAEVYKETPAVEPPADEKRTPKSWTTPAGKQNNSRRKEVATRRGKSDSGREVVSGHAWTQTDVQKEVTLAWSTAGGYGSSSSASPSVTPTTKPVWYGIDGQPVRDRSEKRRGLMYTSAPFGTRMRSTQMATAGTWSPTEVFDSTPPPTRGTSSQTTLSTGGWLKIDDVPETSIVPSDVQGVWEQETTNKAAGFETHPHVTTRVVPGVDAENTVTSDRKTIQPSKHWGQRNKYSTAPTTSTSRGWNQSYTLKDRDNRSQNADINAITRRNTWQ